MSEGYINPMAIIHNYTFDGICKREHKNGALIKCNTSELNRGYINIYLTSMGKSRYNIIINTIRTIHIKNSIVLDLMYGVALLRKILAEFIISCS